MGPEMGPYRPAEELWRFFVAGQLVCLCLVHDAEWAHCSEVALRLSRRKFTLEQLDVRCFAICSVEPGRNASRAAAAKYSGFLRRWMFTDPYGAPSVLFSVDQCVKKQLPVAGDKGVALVLVQRTCGCSGSGGEKEGDEKEKEGGGGDCRGKLTVLHTEVVVSSDSTAIPPRKIDFAIKGLLRAVSKAT